MKICVMFTGGTIGSVLDETGYIGPKEGTTFRVLQLYQEKFETEVEFETVEPYRILSENLGAETIIKLVKSVRDVLEQDKWDGIVITHGTDTLQYGAAMLGYLFGDAGIPIVMVSSNYVLEDERANGLVNFQYAVEYIKLQKGKGVFVSYCNKGEYPTIHRGTRLQPLIPYSDYVASVKDSWYGRFENGNYISNSAYAVKEGQESLLEDVQEVCLSEISDAVLFLHPYVGMQYPHLTDKVKAVLHGSYHSGTISVGEELQGFLKKTKEREIPVYLTGLLQEEKAYETVREYKKLGILPLHTSSEVAQYCKLWLAVSNGLDIKEVMSRSVAEDWI